MTVGQYMRVHEINSTTPDTVERLAWIVCELFGKEPEEVAGWGALKFLRYAGKAKRRATAKPRRWIGAVKLQTDASRITYGQFVEVQHWLKQAPVNDQGEVEIEPVLDLLATSIHVVPAEDHKAAVKAIRGKHFAGVLQQVQRFILSQNELLQNYGGLFGLNGEPVEEVPDDEPLRPKEQEPQFLQQYGWIFSAEAIAELKRVPLDEAYRLPVVEAFNYLAYLKSKAEYNKHLTKK